MGKTVDKIRFILKYTIGLSFFIGGVIICLMNPFYIPIGATITALGYIVTIIY